MNIQANFDKHFSDWLTHCQKLDVMIRSDIQGFIDNDYFRDIVKLGLPALPYIMEKINAGHFPLNYAVSEITHIKPQDIAPSGYSEQEISKVYLDWWNNKHIKVFVPDEHLPEFFNIMIHGKHGSFSGTEKNHLHITGKQFQFIKHLGVVVEI